MTSFILVRPVEVSADWIARRREMIAREGVAVRAGTCKAGFTIESKSQRTNEWHPLGWLGGAICFATSAERDEVLAGLTASAPCTNWAPDPVDAPIYDQATAAIVRATPSLRARAAARVEELGLFAQRSVAEEQELTFLREVLS